MGFRMSDETQVTIGYLVEWAWKIAGLLIIPTIIYANSVLANVDARVTALENRAGVIDATRFTSEDGLRQQSLSNEAHIQLQAAITRERERIDRLEELLKND